MKVNKVLEQPDGQKVEFQGTLEGPELEYAIGYFLNHMLAKGALPFTMRPAVDIDPSAIGGHQ